MGQQIVNRYHRAPRNFKIYRKLYLSGLTDEDLANLRKLCCCPEDLLVIVYEFKARLLSLFYTGLKIMQNIFARPQVTRFQPSGHINASNADAIKEELLAALSSPTSSTLVVDMGNVESLDSAGLMALVSALTLAQKLNRKFLLCAVPPSIRIIFELTQLDRAFEILDDEVPQAAVAA